MTVAVVIPWRDTGCPHRAEALSYVWSRFDVSHSEWAKVTGRDEGAEWCKARAVADGLARTDADVLVICDADVLVPGLKRAVRLVADGIPWVQEHVHVHRLTLESTRAVYATGQPSGFEEKRSPYVGALGGGCVVVRRDVYEDCPLDARFRQWGAEDLSWGDALTVLHPTGQRLDGHLWHLWHPPAPGAHTPNRQTPHRTESHALRFRYAEARKAHERGLPRGREAMRALVEEAKHLTCEGAA